MQEIMVKRNLVNSIPPKQVLTAYFDNFKP